MIRGFIYFDFRVYSLIRGHWALWASLSSTAGPVSAPLSSCFVVFNLLVKYPKPRTLNPKHQLT